ESLAISVLFAPSDTRSYDTAMIVVFETFEVSLPIHASGRIVLPALPSPSPAEVSFGAIEIGRNVRQTLTVRNVGETAAAIDDVHPAPGSPFYVSGSNGGPLPSDPVLPNEDVALEVHFLPSAPIAYGDSLAIAFRGGKTTMVPVSGSGVAPGNLVCQEDTFD